ncbi:glucosamine-6-phosphate isomerase [soil metagenome]
MNDEDVWPLMAIPRDRLGQGSGVRVRVGGDAEALALDMARTMASLIRENNATGRPTCLIGPVGPVGQYAHLARIMAEEQMDGSRTTIINMDEFLGDDGGWIDPAHPLSFRGFMDREFYAKMPPELAVLPQNRIFPDPIRPEGLGGIIAERGGADACFGGIGLNGHIAFNEPEAADIEVFARRFSRVLEIAPESRAHMAVNLSCALDLIPRRAVTVGMLEILAARRLRFYANRPWQRGVVRIALHGPVSAACPASYLQRHPDAELVVTDEVAEAPEVRLR